MKFRFPIVIIDEDFRSENTSGLGIRALAAAIEKEGMEVLGVTSYDDLSQFAQPCELDLRPYAGAVPVELLGNQEFPRVTERPYFLSLGAYSFYWFRLDRPAEAVTVPAGSAEDAPGTTRPMAGEGGYVPTAE